MILLRLTVLAALAALPVVSGPAQAQGFFERLFGVRPLPPPPAPVPQQGRPLPPPPPGVPGVPPVDWAPSNDGTPGPVQPSGPAAARPVAVRPPSEDSVVGRDLKHNGIAGTLRIERVQGSLRAQVTLAGAKISQPTETCSVKLGNGELPLANVGRPEGLPRFEVQVQACPIVFEVLEGAVLVTAPTDACVIQEADCQAEPRGVWGPEPGSLIPRAGEFEQARGSFEKAVRENYRALSQRATPQSVRPIVAEQAAFSSEREQVCRSYAREGAHSFCNARFTEARAVTLASRLGILMQAAEAQPQGERPRRSRPAPVNAADVPPMPAGSDPYYVR